MAKEKNMNDPKRKSSLLFDQLVDKYKSKILKNEHRIKLVIKKFITKHATALSYTGPVEIINFTNADKEVLFEVTNIKSDEILEVTKKTEYFKSVKKVGEEFAIMGDPFVNLIRIMVYVFYEKEGEREAVKSSSTTNQVQLYFLLKLYGSFHYRSFRHGVNKEIMEYTIQNASNKFFIKKMSSMLEVLIHLSTTNIENMKEHIDNKSDYSWIFYFTNLYSRLNSLIKNISKKFYENRDSGNKVLTDNIRKQDIEGEDYLDITTSVSGDIENITRKIVIKMSSDSSPDLRLLNRATKKTKISINKMSDVIKSIQSNNDKDLIQLIREILSFYLRNRKTKTIKSTIFLNTMENAYGISNTNDPNILKIKELLDSILKRYSTMYLNTNRAGTLSNMRLTVYLYTIYYIGRYCE